MEILDENKKRHKSLGVIQLNNFHPNRRSLNFINIEKRNLKEYYKKFDHLHYDQSHEKKKNERKSESQKNLIHKEETKGKNSQEEDILKIILQKLEIIPNKEEKVNSKMNRLGSLLQLFQSEYFDLHLLLCYLDKKEDQGVVDTLVNRMYQNFINESFFYIPQLCTMITYKSYYESLENYLLDRCVDQMKFSLKIHWLISSYTDSADEPKVIKKYDKLIQRIEMTLVNGRRATLSSFRLYNALNIKSEEEVYKHSLDKEYRLNYFEKTMRFYHEMKSMCEKLKDRPKENKLDPSQTRNAVMRTQLQHFNKNIKRMFSSLDENTKTTTKSFYRGYILPFDDSTSTMDDYNSLIVNFLPEHSFCFSTKARVPVKITCEVVRVLECAYWDQLILEKEPEDQENVEISYIATEENNKFGSSIPKEEMKVNEYSSIDDFFKKILTKEEESKETEIKKIVDNITQANENGVTPRLSLLKRDSVISDLHSPSKEEDFLFDSSEDTVNPFGPKWSDITKSIKDKSIYRNFETYSVKSFIAKANDDLRQEMMTMQLIKRFDDIFTKAEIPLKLRPYEILITSPSSGLIEFLPNSISIDALKKNLPDGWNLNIFFRNFFKNNFEEAQKNFAQSLAAYSLITYIIAIRDRHNGNILLDMNGNIIHIDFGFILGISPGNLNFESAPFKLTSEYVEIMDGFESNIFHYFKSLILRGLMELKKHVDSFVKIIDIMARGSKMPCFNNVDTNLVIQRFVERFHMNKSELEYIKIVDEMLNNSLNNWRTDYYDYFQKLTNDIRP